jgi:ATP-dependent Clp protease ATP-binding subunit ClpC
MFDRYNEDARRALFFARYAVTEHGGGAIEPEHVVLGVLRGGPQAVFRFAAVEDAARVIGDSLVQTLKGPRLATSLEIPFSLRTRDALERALVEADDLGNTEIWPEHLMLGVLVKTSGAATDALTKAGVEIAAIRRFLQVRPAAE